MGGLRALAVEGQVSWSLVSALSAGGIRTAWWSTMLDIKGVNEMETIAGKLEKNEPHASPELIAELGGKWDEHFWEFQFPDGSTGRFVEPVAGCSTRTRGGASLCVFRETIEDEANT